MGLGIGSAVRAHRQSRIFLGGNQGRLRGGGSWYWVSSGSNDSMGKSIDSQE